MTRRHQWQSGWAKQWVALLAGVLCLAALLNIGVSAILFLRHPYAQPEAEFGIAPMPGAPKPPGVASPAPWPGRPPVGWPDHPTSSVTLRFPGMTKRNIDASAPAMAMGGRRFAVYVVQAGWPFRALDAQWWQEVVEAGGAPPSMRTVRRSGPTYAAPNVPGAIAGRDLIPLVPIWPGFLMNTGLYTALIFLPVGVIWLVRRSKQRAHLCPACGYSRAGLAQDAPCPECGRREEETSLLSAAPTSAGPTEGAGQ